MSKYRKKPVVIDAVQWNSYGDAPIWAQPHLTEHPDCCSIETLEGTMRCNPTDWILKGVNGEIYPCKHEIFIKTYEPAN